MQFESSKYLRDGLRLYKISILSNFTNVCLQLFADEGLKSEEPLAKLVNNGNKLQGFRSHPLFFAITLGLLAEIINSR